MSIQITAPEKSRLAKVHADFMAKLRALPEKRQRAVIQTTAANMFGTADPYTPPEHLAELEAAGVTVLRYEGAEHGFVHDADRPAHRAADAADAWSKAIAWLTPA